MLRRILFRMTIMLGVCYIGVCIMLAFVQRKLIYAPNKGPVSVTDSGYAPDRIREVYLAVENGIELRGWYCQAEPSETSSATRLGILFPGNAGNRLNRVRILNMLNDLGCDALIFDYRGYGGSGGHPSETAITLDSMQVWNFSRKELGFSNDRIVVFGQSLGGGVATRLVWELCEQGDAPAGLVLQGTFTSLADAAKHRYPWLPVNALLVDRYPSIERIPAITCPLLMLHGKLDNIVPHSLGEQLFAAAPERSHNGIIKRLVTLHEAGHNNMMHVARDEIHTAKQQFLQEIDHVTHEHY